MFRRILWAVDPNHDTENLGRRLIPLLRAMTRAADDVTVEPVHILAPEPDSVPLDYVARRDEGAAATLDDWLLANEIPGRLPFRFLVSPLAEAKVQAESLLSYAIENHFDLIVGATNTRRPLERRLLGSFMETLLELSPIPILTANPSARIPAEIREILFPCDLDPRAEKLYDQVIDLAWGAKAHLVLVHKRLGSLLPPIAEVPFRPVAENFVRNQAAVLEFEDDQMDAWLAKARERSVEADAVIEDEPIPVADTLLSFVGRLGEGILAMASHSSRRGAAAIGSTTREVIRSATWPVLSVNTNQVGREAKLSRAG